MGLLKNLFLPSFCLFCSRLGNPICPDCLTKFEIYYPQKPLATNFFSSTHSLYRYNNQASYLIKKAKYRFLKIVLNYFLESVPWVVWESSASLFLKLNKPVITYVPVTERDKQIRGFNQAELIAGFVSRMFKIPVADCVAKNKSNLRQAMLRNHQERFKNVRGAYALINNQVINNKEVVLIDDVITTGATIGEVGQQLLGGKARKIIAWSLFRSY